MWATSFRLPFGSFGNYLPLQIFQIVGEGIFHTGLKFKFHSQRRLWRKKIKFLIRKAQMKTSKEGISLIMYKNRLMHLNSYWLYFTDAFLGFIWFFIPNIIDLKSLRLMALSESIHPNSADFNEEYGFIC